MFTICSRCAFSLFFFFQAEDGIRDLVRSRGLGDVYKRQAFIQKFEAPVDDLLTPIDYTLADTQIGSGYGITAVSYTHLTLPTSDLV
mgnify:CR=1 FL=1